MALSQKFQTEQDPGTGAKYERRTARIINRDGSFNVIRKGGGFSLSDMFQYLVTMRWHTFLFTVGLGFALLNLLFACLYMMIGVEGISGAYADTFGDRFYSAVFFSTQTFTTVGYGAMAPKGMALNVLSSFEALTGLLFFALATGMLYGRFSRPNARVIFARQAVITPFQGGKALMFRFANARQAHMLHMQAHVIMSVGEKTASGYERKYFRLKLEVETVVMLPLTWTLVHVINEESPLYNLSLADLIGRDGEVMVMVRGFDETYGQEVHFRQSYLFTEVVEGKKYKRAFHTQEDGITVLHLDQVSELENA